MVARVYITAGRVSVSRPGYDVLSVPRTPDYMAVDSSFPASVRLLKSGIVFGVTSNVLQTVLYDTTYAVPPIVEVTAYTSSIQRLERAMVMGRGSGQPKWFTAPMNIHMLNDRFQFAITDPTAEGGYGNVARDWIYFVYSGS